jgi:single-stranded-DNA-specific exonuclease
LNAVGRLGSPTAAFELLTARSTADARPLAEELDRANRERQDQTRAVLEQAQGKLGGLAEVPALIFDADRAYGEGLLGPAAAKLVEEWHRPAVLVSLRDDIGRGSARSVKGFHITEALEASAHLLERFGGHAAAAGFSVLPERIPELKAHLERLASDRLESPGAPTPLEIDAVVEPLDVNRRLVDFLDRLEPLGSGFPPPLLACLGMTVVSTRPVGRDRSHLKLVLRHGDRTVDAIAFRGGARSVERGARIDLAFYAEREMYMGLEGIRWNVQGIRPAEAGPVARGARC